MKNNVNKQTNTTAILISLISSFIGIVMVVAVCISFYIQKQNEKIYNESPYVVIYQYEVSDFNINLDSKPIEIYREKFTKDLKYEAVITALDGKGTNKIIIENGRIYISEANCHNKICKSTVIDKDGLIKATQIVCNPNGLIIKLEEGNK